MDCWFSTLMVRFGESDLPSHHDWKRCLRVRTFLGKYNQSNFLHWTNTVVSLVGAVVLSNGNSLHKSCVYSHDRVCVCTSVPRVASTCCVTGLKAPWLVLSSFNTVMISWKQMETAFICTVFLLNRPFSFLDNRKSGEMKGRGYGMETQQYYGTMLCIAAHF